MKATLEHARPRLVSNEPAVQLFYEQCLENGCTEKLAEALAFRQGPALRTDAAFLEGHSNGNQFAGSKEKQRAGDFYARKAKAAGVSTQGKVYLSTLAAYPGDPRAWVADRHDVETVLAERGWGSTGMVNRKANEPVSDPLARREHPDGVAPDIINDELAATLAANPEIAPTPKERRALREKIVSKRKPHWVK